MYGRTFFTALTLVAALATALVYGLGGWLAFTGSLSAGDVVALALLLSRLYGPLTALANVRVDVMSAMVSFDRVFEVLDLQPMIREAPDAVPVPAGDRSIEFDARRRSATPRPPTSRCRHWRRCRCPSTAARSTCCTTSPSGSSPGTSSRWSGTRARASRRSRTW